MDIYLSVVRYVSHWDRSVRCKRTDQSAAAVVCLMSPPANEKPAFTYIRLQRTDRSQRGKGSSKGEVSPMILYVFSILMAMQNFLPRNLMWLRPKFSLIKSNIWLRRLLMRIFRCNLNENLSLDKISTLI